MHNQDNLEQTDPDFNIEEVEQVVAPDVTEEPNASITTSIVTVCRCS
jgi:hypothetical protein